MYGVVLMVAMAGGAETPALFNRGCNGCCGAVSYSCCGYSCHGGCTGKAPKMKHKSCHGCSGSSCHGCSGYSSCHGCSGYSSCHGCSGYSSCHGCSGYSSCQGAPVGCYGAPVVTYPVVPVTPVDPKPPVKGKIEKLKKPPVDNETISAPARITVTVPSDARLSIDGAMTVSTETTRVFESPILVGGKSYSYTFQAEFVRDGKNVVVTREVKVQAGSEITVSLENASVVASR